MGRLARALANAGMPLALGLLVSAGPLFFGCGTGGSGDVSVDYKNTAKENYDKGMAALADEAYPEAIKYFNHVKQRYPFSKFAVMAELRLADTQYARGRLLEAIDEYKLFVRAHPTHEEVTRGYPEYKVCEAYVKQIPSDFFLIPPSHEKDQSATRDAGRELRSFLTRHPDSKYAPDAKKLLADTTERLAQAELYVAKFYASRDKPNAVIWRLENMLKLYSGTRLDAEALLLLGESYGKANQWDKARETYAKLAHDFPKTKEGGEAQKRLDELSKATKKNG